MNFQSFYFNEEEKRGLFGAFLKNDIQTKELRRKYWPEILTILSQENVGIQGKGQNEILSTKTALEQTGGNFKARVNKEGIPRSVAANKVFEKIEKNRELKVEKTSIQGSNAPWLRIYDKKSGEEFLRLEFKEHPSMKVGGSDFEPAIINAWNQMNGIKTQKLPEKEGIQEAAQNIAEYLKKNLIKSNKEAIHVGSKQLGLNTLSDFWKRDNLKPDSTPKTDIIIADKKISLKMGNNAQLSSGKVIGAEGTKLIETALNDPSVKRHIDKEVEFRIKEMIQRRNKRISQDKTTYVAMKGGDVKEFGRAYFEPFHKELSSLLQEVAQSNPNFARVLTYEAMVGEKKFNERGQIGIADFLLASSEDGSVIKWHPKTDMGYIDKISKQVDIYVAFKSSRGSTYSALRIALKKILNDGYSYKTEEDELKIFCESIEQAAKEMGVKIEYSQIDESVWDTLKGWSSRIISTIKSTIQKGIDYLMKLFGIEIDKVEIDDEGINFLE